MELVPLTKKHYRQIRRLYISAFPAAERKPFSLLLFYARKRRMELLCLLDNCRPVGLVFGACWDDMVLIDYLAIDKTLRGHGYGSKALDLIRAHWPDKRVFLEVEEPDIPAENLEERLRRIRFYNRGGVVLSDTYIRVYGVDMRLMHFGEPVRYDEYLRLLNHAFGTLIVRNLKPVCLKEGSV